MRAALGRGGDIAQAIGAFFGVGRLVEASVGDQKVDRLDHKEENSPRHDQERDQGIDKLAIHELTAVKGEKHAGKIGNFCHRRNEWRDQVLDQRGNQGTKGSANDHADGQVNYVAAKQELSKFLEHAHLNYKATSSLGAKLVAIVQTTALPPAKR